MPEYVTPRGVRIATSDLAARAVGYAPLGSSKPAEGGAPKGNASRDEWAAYADSLGVQYDEDAKRDDIKAAVSAVQG